MVQNRFLLSLFVLCIFFLAVANALVPRTLLLPQSRTGIITNTWRSRDSCTSTKVLSPALAAASSSSSSTSTISATSSFDSKFTKLLSTVTNLFPLWVISFSILGYQRPHWFLWFKKYITPALAATMLGMGMSLTVEDFVRVFKTPQYVAIGFLAQYSIMPLAAAGISRVLQLGPELAAGLILVGCAPGGTASNLVTLIAGADIALSVLMTAVSTVAAVVMTPLLTSWLAGSYVTIKASDLVLSTLQVVLAPVLGGLAINTFAPKVSKAVSRYTPIFSVLLVSTICGTISASNKGVALGMSAFKLVGGIVALHSLGFVLGYLAAYFTGAGETRARTISIETGMQNSALAVVLAQHFPNPVLSSLPGALSATVHSVLGSLAAGYWRSHPPANNPRAAEEG